MTLSPGGSTIYSSPERSAKLLVATGTTSGEIYMSPNGGERWKLIADGLPPVSQGRPLTAALTAMKKNRCFRFRPKSR